MKTSTLQIAASVKPSAFASIKLMDFVRSESGDVQAQAELRLAVIYTAYYHILKAGNRTQWDMLAAACAMYSDMAQVKTALGIKTINKAAKHMQRTYMAYGAALAAVGVPGVMKMAQGSAAEKAAAHEAWDAQAAILASEFVCIVDAGMSDDVSAEEAARIADEKAAAAQARADKKAADKAAADKALADTIAAEARKLAESGEAMPEMAVTASSTLASAVTLIQAGAALEDEIRAIEQAIAAYRDAQQTAEIAALLAMATPAFEEVAA